MIIDWYVEQKFSGILTNNPHIDNIYTLNLKNNKIGYLNEYKKLKELSQNNYDLVIDLQGLIKSAIVSKILCKNVIGFDKNSLRESLASRFYAKSFSIAYEENVIIRNIKLVCKALDLEIPNIQEKQPFLYTKSNLNIKPTLLIITGSSWPSKVYPKEHFVKIINSLHVTTFVSWGNQEEEKNAKYICNNTKAQLLPKLTIDELKDVVSSSSLVIGGDSGPTHMAWALNIPSITIFGPTPSQRNTLTTQLNLTIDCQKDIDAKNLNKNDYCIKNINPQEIIKKARVLLAC
jgi:heptosyltransferase-1